MFTENVVKVQTGFERESERVNSFTVLLKFFLALFFISIFLCGFFSQTVRASAVTNPTLSWSTFFGGNSTDQIRNVITDSSGNIYAVGYSDATWGSPIVAYTGHHDGFLAKFSSSGNLVWNTFMGASTADIAYSLVRDTSGNIYVTGYSNSTWGSPIAAFGGVEDAFVAKFDSSGNRTWNTFIGGAGQDEAYGISIGADGNIYILGGMATATWGSPIRSFGGSIDGFLEKLDTSGNVLWHTFVGGTGGEFADSFVQDSQNNIYVVGYGNGTWGSPLHAHSGGGFDGYITKFDNSGNLTWNTFFGGSGNELFYIGSMVLDSGNNLYATGYSTATWGSPLTSYTTGDEGYLVKFDSNGSLTWNTFFGGSGSDQPKGITIDSSGNVYVIGTSTATWGSPLSAYVAGSDGFLAGFDDTGSRLWSTFMGGSGNDTGASVHYFNGDLFVGGYSTATWGSPINTYNAGTDSFLVRYDGPPLISLVSDSPSSSNSIIQWTTNEVASSKVDYGLTNSYGNTTSETDTSTRVTSHSVTLSSLVACSTYHYRVRSKDSALNETIDSDNTFTTTGCTGSASVDSQTSSSITTASGGSLSLLTDSKGVTLTVPASFSGSDANFQIKQLDSTAVTNTTSTPTGFSLIGSYLYDLKALTDVSTSISSFDNPITVAIAYGTSDISGINESSLKIYRWDGNTWNQLSGCSLNTSTKTVSCTTTNFSVFGLFGQASATPTPTNTPTPTTGSTTSTTTTSTSTFASVCNDQSPGVKAPWLYGAITQDSGSVLLYFTEADNPVSKYVLEYGTKSGEYPYGVQDMGVNLRGQMTFLVKSLSPNTTYYFKVRGGNGCATGTWSNEISAKTKGLVSYDQLDITSSELKPVKEVSEPKSCQIYTVKSGDTLWSIASDLLNDGSKYKDIIEQNKDKYSSLETSNNLKTGWELKIDCGKTTTEENKKQSQSYDVDVKVVDTNKNPVEGATVTLHSDPQTTKTNKDGIAEFKNVEAGDHKVLIAYKNFEGEQSVNLTGNVKKFELNVTVKQKAISFSPLAYGIIGIMGLVIFTLATLLIKAKK